MTRPQPRSPSVRAVGLLIAASSLLCAAAALAGGAINATVDKPKVTVGDPFVYTVTLTIPRDAQADLPGDKAKFARLEVRDYQPTQQALPDGTQQIVLKYTLVSFDVGVAEMKDFRVKVTGSDKKVDTYLAPPLEVEVASVLPKQGQVEPKGFYGPVMLKSPWSEWLLAGLIALAILAAAGLVVWLLLRRRARKAEEEVVEVLAPDAAALRALRRLEQDKAAAAGDWLSFYCRLGEIMRAWLEARFGIPALVRTTTGIMYYLRVRRDSDEWRKQYLEILAACDGVKFAKAEPTDAQAYTNLQTAEAVIDKARAPEPEPPPADKKEGGQ